MIYTNQKELSNVQEDGLENQSAIKTYTQQAIESEKFIQ
jgi:hypothetical protein